MNPKIAYFSAEIGIDSRIKTYSGGLGILAGDTIKAMADLGVELCAVTLLYKKGFLKQKIVDNIQVEEDDEWDFMNLLQHHGHETKVNISGEDVYIKIWKYEYTGVKGHKIPIYFLDTDLAKNPKWAQEITNRLYQGDRLAQEIVLGIGGVRALDVVGHHNIKKYHMNEGHSAFLTLEIYRRLGESMGWDDGHVKDRCVFTTHTPIPAGHDVFDYSEVEEKLKGEPKILPLHIRKLAGEDRLNMTRLAMSFSSYINAVSRKHKEVTEEMFPDHTIDYITNGIHVDSWVSNDIKFVLDKYIPGWKEDYSKLEKVFDIPNEEIRFAHRESRRKLIEYVNENNITGVKLDQNRLAVGFARRFVQYKDAELIFKNMNNLKRLGTKVQFIFAGKSHSRDGIGKDIMRRIIEHAKALKDEISIAFIEDYKIEVTTKMVQGCDLWLNTPIPPNEASGTSGMKAAANGCLHFSRLDGWAIESYEMNGGGYPICEYQDFITTLEYKIIPLFYAKNREAWSEQIKLTMGINGSYFNTHRMAREYLNKAYKIN